MLAAPRMPAGGSAFGEFDFGDEDLFDDVSVPLNLGFGERGEPLTFSLASQSDRSVPPPESTRQSSLRPLRVSRGGPGAKKGQSVGPVKKKKKNSSLRIL